MAAPLVPARFVPESSIIRPVGEDLSNEEWPTFVLADAIVYRPDGVTMANALLVDQEGPFIVRGRLELDEEDDVQYLVKPNVRSANIEIKDSKSYSIGYDPQAVIWLSGNAGWFELNPHPSYARIFQDMCEVSQLYYTLMEIYNEVANNVSKSDRRKALAALDIKEVLFEHAVAVGDGTTYDETVDKCIRLGPALLTHLGTATDLPWKSTSFYTWLVKELKNKERFKRSSSRAASVSDTLPPPPPPKIASAVTPVPIPIPPSSISSYASQPQPSPQQLPFRAPPTSGLAKPTVRNPSDLTSKGVARTSPAPSPIPSGQNHLSREERQVAFDMFLKAVETIGREKSKSERLTPGMVHAKLSKLYRTKEYITGKALSAYFGRDLLKSLSDIWRGSQYVKYLASDQAKAFMPISDLFLKDMPQQLRRRNHSSARLDSPASVSASSPDPVVQQVPRTAGKRAVLRPPTVSRKRRFDGAFTGAGQMSDGLGDDSDGILGDTDVAMSDVPDSSWNTPHFAGRQRKVAKNAQDDGPILLGSTESMQLDAGNENSAISGEEEEDSDNEDSDDSEQDETLFAVHSQPLIVSIKPTGPNQTWNCPQPGCHFFVRNAGTPLDDDSDNDDDDGGGGGDSSEDDGDSADVRQRATHDRIRAHLRSHEDELLSRVDLAISEGSRRHVPVNNLLAKIRALANKGDMGRTAGPPGPAATATIGTSSSSLRRFLF